MSQTIYNLKLSARANESMRRRQEELRRQKRIITFAAIILISVIAILCSSIKAFAKSENEMGNITKMYTSIRVEAGDTLWDIAERYNICSDLSREQYIEELKNINHLSDDEIHSGEYLVVSYYEIEQ